MMTVRHRDNRLQWVRRFIGKGDIFQNKVIFRGEKTFKPDVPDGLVSYCHDLRREERIFSKRQNGGAYVMVWGGISPYELSPLGFWKERKIGGNTVRFWIMLFSL